MKSSNFNLRPILLSFFALLTLLGLTIKGGAQQGQTLDLGLFLPSESQAEQGARLALEALAGRDLRDSLGRPYRLEAVTLDGLASEELVGLDVLLGPLEDAEAFAHLDTLANWGLPVLTLATGDSLTRLDQTERIFRLRPAERYYSYALADTWLALDPAPRIALVQSGIPPTEAVVAAQLRLEAGGLPPVLLIQREEALALEADVAALLSAQASHIAFWGEPAEGLALWVALREAGWEGVFFARPALNDPSAWVGALGVAAWTYAENDPASRAFVADFVSRYGRPPDESAAAAYDAVLWLAERWGAVGDKDVLGALRNAPPLRGLLGVFLTPLSAEGDVARTVGVYEILAGGGLRGLARYENERLLPSEVAPVPESALLPTPTPTLPPSPVPSATPPPSPTPNRPQVNVIAEAVPYYGGPDTVYGLLGTLPQGAILDVLAADSTLAWLAVLYRGNLAWLENNPLQVSLFDPAVLVYQLPILQAPPTPIGGASPTPDSVTADLVIESVLFVPASPIPGQTFVANVTVRNVGQVAARRFVVAGLFPPGGAFSSNTVEGLAPQGVTTVSLAATVNSTGDYNVDIGVDVNNTVWEGLEGETNNFYRHPYRADYVPTRAESGFTLVAGNPVDVTGGQADLLWTGTSLEAQNGARLGIITSASFDAASYDTLNPSLLTESAFTDEQLLTGVLIGVVSGEGQRALIRIDGFNPASLTLSYKAYGF